MQSTSRLLPALLLFRMARHVRSRKRLGREFLSALPYLTLFVVVWAWGEFLGYLFGPGESLTRIE